MNSIIKCIGKLALSSLIATGIVAIVSLIFVTEKVLILINKTKRA